MTTTTIDECVRQGLDHLLDDLHRMERVLRVDEHERRVARVLEDPTPPRRHVRGP